MFKYFFKRDTVFASIAVFMVMGLFALMPINTHILDPIRLALQDFDYNDMAWSKMGKHHKSVADTAIVVVNIDTLTRPGIATLVKKVTEQKPKVLAVDVLFNEPRNAGADALLGSIFSTDSTVVMAYNFKPDSGKQDGYFYPAALRKGYIDFVGEEGGVIRYFAPRAGDGKYSAFATEIARVAYPDQYRKLLKRHHDTEAINYTLTSENIVTIDGQSILEDSTAAGILKGKTVLLGYVSRSETDVEDKHFTPLNSKYSGKSLPDMNGVMIHANIVSMIARGGYIQKTASWLNWLLAFVLCWTCMAVFIKYYKEHHLWFHLVAKIVQIVLAVLFVYIGLLFLHKWDIKINMTAALTAIILAVDVLYFYEAFAIWLNKKTGYKTIFGHAKHH